MKRFLEFISRASQSRTTAVLVILVIGASIPLTVLVAQRQQNIQQKAANDGSWMINSSGDQVWLPAAALDPEAPEFLYESICGTGCTPLPDNATISPEPGSGNLVTTPTTAVPAGGAPATGTTSSSCIAGQAFCSGTQICICKSDGTPGQCGACTNGNACAPGAGSSAATCGGVNLIINADLRISGNGLIASLSQGPVVNTTAGSQLYIEWTTINNPTSCVASGAWSGNKPTSGTDLIPAAAGVYTITCSRAGAADVSDSITVTMSPSATPATCDNIYGEWQNWTCGKQGSSIKCASNQMYQTRSGSQRTGCSTPLVLEQCIDNPVCNGATPTGNVTLSLGLNGIGSVGDSKNPGTNNLSIKNPARSPQFTIEIAGSTTTFPGTYNSSTGLFTANPTISIPAGNYDIFIKAPGHLRKKVGNTNGLTTGINVTGNLPAGDLNDDKAIDVLDYNILTSCMSGFISYNASTCGNNSQAADLNLDGKVDQFDYNLLLREFGQAGN